MNIARPLRKILFWLTAIPLFLLLVVLLVVGFVISTETGFHGLLDLAQRFMPGQLSYEKASGRLIGPLSIENLRYEDGPLKVALARGDFDWQPADLLSRALTVDRLHIKGLEMDLPASETPPEPESTEPFELPDVQLPIAITLVDIQGRDMLIRPAGAEPVQIDRIDLKARTEADTLRIELLDVRSPLADARLDGQITPVGNYPLQLKLDWRVPTPAYGDFKGSGEVNGELREQLALNHTITGAAALKLVGDLGQVLTGKPAWAVKLQLDVADMQPFVPDLAGKPLTARIDAKGVLTQFEGSGQIKATAPEIGPAILQFVATGDEKAVRLDQLKLSADNHPMALDARGKVQLAELRFDADGEWKALAWPLKGTPAIESTAGKFTAKGTPKQYRLTLSAKFKEPPAAAGLGPFIVRVDAAGTDQAVKLNTLRVAAVDRALALNAKGDFQFADLRFNADGQWQSLAWPLAGTPEVASPSGQFSASGTPRDYRLQLNARLNGPPAAAKLGPVNLSLKAAGTDQAVKLDELKLAAADRPLALDAKGSFRFAELSFDADGQWKSLVWPLAGKPQFESAAGAFKIDGMAKDYRFRLVAQVQGADIPKGRWSLSGKGSDQAVREVKLVGETLEGRIEGNVDAAWLPAVRWNALLAANGINPGVQWSDVPGKLNLRLKSDGGLANGTLQANVLLEEFSGRLKGQSLRGNANVSVQDQDLNIKTLQLSAGQAQLEAQGVLAKRWDLRWKLDVPQLQRLVPDLKGSIVSTGTLGGSMERPRVDTRFTIQGLQQGETKIKRLSGDANVDITDKEHLQIKLSGEGLALGGQTWTQLRVDGGGTPAAHQLSANIEGDLGRFMLALTGNLNLKAMDWQGRINQLAAEKTMAGDWALVQAVAVQASARKARLGNACLRSNPTRVCMQGQWEEAGGFSGRLQLRDFEPQRFRSFFPEGMDLVTRINADANASGTTKGTFKSKVDLTIAPGTLNMVAQGNPLKFTLNGGHLRMSATERNATGDFNFDVADTARIKADMQVRDPLGAGQMNGKVNAEFIDLGIISVFAPQIQEIKGQLRADVGIKGAVKNPLITGDVKLVNASAAVPEAGMLLKDIKFAVSGTGRGPLKLTGSIKSGEGNMAFNGEVEPTGPKITMNISGREFQAFDTNDMRIRLSPDLDLNIDSQRISVKGQVTIPRAYINPVGAGGKGGPSAVRGSDDVVIVNDPAGEEKKQGAAVYADVRVILGDEVEVAMPSFKGKLKGNLRIEQAPEFAPRGTGAVGVVSGKYTIFGQELDIQRGQVLFSSSPLDNPGLDMRVVRTVNEGLEDVIAGAQVRGTVKRPRFNLFSQPPMPDNRILSYIILGRAPQGGEAGTMFKAASALGMGADMLTQGMGAAVGLDTLSYNPDANDGGGAVTLGKYLTPDLYVGYGVGLADAVNTIYIKYRIIKGLMFESDSSAVGYGADLIYSFER